MFPPHFVSKILQGFGRGIDGAAHQHGIKTGLGLTVTVKTKVKYCRICDPCNLLLAALFLALTYQFFVALRCRNAYLSSRGIVRLP